ncbi:MAG: uncharacterized protein JWO60_744 [Frankiales bacterium]|nr:uncharacterized protein [Frankiales bacterium]
MPREFAVHSLEHGAVWLAHRPGIDAAPLGKLAESGEAAREYVLVSPVPGLASDVLAVAWGVSLAVESPTDRRLAQFVQTYAGGGQGGEKGAPCTSSPSALSPEQAEAALGESSTSA